MSKVELRNINHLKNQNSQCYKELSFMWNCEWFKQCVRPVFSLLWNVLENTVVICCSDLCDSCLASYGVASFGGTETFPSQTFTRI